MMPGTIAMIGTRLIVAVATAAASTMAAGLGNPVNTGRIDPATWIRGPLYAAPATKSIWNPAKLKLMSGGELVLGTVSTYSLTNYCSIAVSRAGTPSDSTWVDMQHSDLDWTQTWSMWSQPCAYNNTTPGTRIAYTHKREIQKALDGGAMVLIIPTVDSAKEAQDIIDLAFYPPVGHRKYGPSQARQMYANVPGGYRETFNDNVVIIMMIETILGSQEANAIGTLPHIDGLFGATADLGNFSGYANPMLDYEKLIRNTYDAAHTHGTGACSAFGFRNRTYPTAP